jgi:hypothetical protein
MITNEQEDIEKVDILTPKQEQFCRAYILNDLTYSNGVLSYAYAYGFNLEEASHELEIDPETNKQIPKSSQYDRMHNVCGVASHRMLRNSKIQRRMNELLREVLNEADVDSELAKVIRQNGRLDVKVQAIKEFNALKGRIVKKQDLTSNGERLVIMPAEIMQKYALANAETTSQNALEPLQTQELAQSSTDAIIELSKTTD